MRSGTSVALIQSHLEASSRGGTRAAFRVLTIASSLSAAVFRLVTWMPSFRNSAATRGGAGWPIQRTTVGFTMPSKLSCFAVNILTFIGTWYIKKPVNSRQTRRSNTCTGDSHRRTTVEQVAVSSG